jgi:alkanesulfonate monooxygenase SsuD/methylene tetrahydromethanopterin reductase-like flavin-dependent oxidoreductase (luciferase family)
VLDVYTDASLAAWRNATSGKELRQEVARLDDMGVTGCTVGDHLFMSHRGDEAVALERSPDLFTDDVSKLLRSEDALLLGFDPLMFLSAIGGMSDRLVVGTKVKNVGLTHPALVFRQFAQLAAMYGGERVLAGIGAGWNREEFRALGMAMPKHAARLEHLRGAAELARRLFDEGAATLSWPTFAVEQLPTAPRPKTAPRLMVGGSSRALLSIAAQYGDQVDLEPLARSEAQAVTHRGSFIRGLAAHALTTMADMDACVAVLEDVARENSREPDSIVRSITLFFVSFCGPGQVEERERELCGFLGIEPRPLGDCPYVLVGDQHRMRDLLSERVERIGLTSVSVMDGPHLAPFNGPHLGRFIDEVAAHVA